MKVVTVLFLLYCDVNQSEHIVEKNVVRDLVLSIVIDLAVDCAGGGVYAD